MTLCGEDHGKVIARINRIEGQVRGLKKMVEDDRDCLQVIKQIAAASGALRSLGSLILEDHLKGCVSAAIRNRGNEEKLIAEVHAHRVKKFKSWLYVMTKNYCLMEIRSGKTRKRKMEKWISEQEYSVEFNEELHPIDKDKATQDMDLRECIDKLKEMQKRCIQLFYFESKSYREIAEMMELDEKKVKSYLQNGKRNIKICLGERNDNG